MMEVSAENRRRIGFLILALACIGFTVRGFASERLFFWSRDFKPLYAGARCLLHHRNPYDADALRLEYTQAGGSLVDLQPFQPHYALYPPPALFVVMPLALLPWEPAHLLFLAASAGLITMASFVVAALCSAFSPLLVPVLISIFLIGANTSMMLAQPALIAIGLCVIGVGLLLQQKHTALAVFCFALSLTLKPQTGSFVWLYFFVVARYRVKAVAIFALVLLLCAPGIVWASVTPASAHWLQDLRANLKITELHGSLSDPGPGDALAYNITTLQTIVSLVRDEKPFYNVVSWSVCGVLLVWMFVLVRRNGLSHEQEFFAIAALTSLSLLPIYHRTYDAKLQLLCFPALAVVLHRAVASWKERRSSITETTWPSLPGWSVLAIALALLLENDRYSYRLNAMMHAPDPRHLLRSIVLLRNFPLILLTEAVLYLALLQFARPWPALQVEPY